MSEKNKIKAREWLEKAKHDLETVKLIIDSSGTVPIGLGG